MDYQTVLHEIASWPVDEQVRLIQEVSDRLGLDGAWPNLTDEQRAELERRAAELDARPEIGVPWEEARARILAKLDR